MRAISPARAMRRRGCAVASSDEAPKRHCATIAAGRYRPHGANPAFAMRFFTIRPSANGAAKRSDTRHTENGENRISRRMSSSRAEHVLVDCELTHTSVSRPLLWRVRRIKLPALSTALMSLKSTGDTVMGFYGPEPFD